MSPAGAVNGVVTFADGLPGFEASRRFVLVTSPSIAPFTIVQGVDGGAPSFVAIEPHRVDAAYLSGLSDADRVRLDAVAETPLVWLALVTAQADRSATVNLRAPLVINPGSMRGIQIMAAESGYRVDHPLPPV
jgi:flagellar assembly factor FliW